MPKVNFVLLQQFVKILEFYIDFLVHTPINKMDSLNENIGTL